MLSPSSDTSSSEAIPEHSNLYSTAGVKCGWSFPQFHVLARVGALGAIMHECTAAQGSTAGSSNLAAGVDKE